MAAPGRGVGNRPGERCHGEAMSEVRWVCLSDTHFGAENSILSHVPAGGTSVDASTPGPVLTALVDCLADLTRRGCGGRRPTLVLNGDILELALAQDNVAAMVFDRFIDLAFGGPDPIFDDTIVFVPGNHDHHLWETARERQYADYVATVPPHEPLAVPWHVTRLFPRESSTPLEAELLTGLIRRRLGRAASVRVVYPNFGVASADGSHVVVFHHGHFVEPLYRLMSIAKHVLFPGQAPGPEVWDWEADNFAWIDFFWSTLGRSGDAGEDVGFIYDMLQDPQALSALAGNAGAAAGARAPTVVRPIARPLAAWVVARLARAIRARERANPDVLLTPAAQAGLDAYLAGPLLRQLTNERRGSVPDTLDFVFGHTHKPFEDLRAVAGVGPAVGIVNTGGWVVDTADTSALQGASIVVVDDDCNVVAIRAYNQTPRKDGYRVTMASSTAGGVNPLQEMLADRLDLASPPWEGLSGAIADAVDQRHVLLPQIIRAGVKLTAS